MGPDSRVGLRTLALVPTLERFAAARPRNERNAVRAFRLVLVLGLVASAYVFRDFLRRSALGALEVGWSFVLLFPLFVAWTLAAARAWRALLSARPRAAVPGMRRLFVLRTEAAALSFALPAGGIAGDVLRAAGTRSKGGFRSSAPPVVLDRIAMGLGELAVGYVGLVLYAGTGVEDRWGLSIAAGSLVVLAALLLGWRRLASRAAGLRWPRRLRVVPRSLDILLASTTHGQAFRRAVGWHVVERTLVVAEVWLIARLLGLPLTPSAALLAGGLMTLFGLAAVLLPAQAGAHEGALIVAFELAHLPGAAGLSVALVRRARQLVTTAAGLLLLLREGERTLATGFPRQRPVEP